MMDRDNAAVQLESQPCIPIAQLQPFMRSWRIRARVIVRSEVRHFTNARGVGKLFSVELLDAEGSVCRATMFSAAVDKYYELLTPSGIFDMSGGTVKQANTRYCPHAVEITFDERAVISQLADDGVFPRLHYNFVPLASLPNIPPGAMVDVATILTEKGEIMEVTTKRGNTVLRCHWILVDGSGKSCRCTFWGSHAKAVAGLEVGNVVFLFQARVSDFKGGRCLDIGDSSAVESNPDDERAFKLHRWFTEHGGQFKAQPAVSGGESASFLAHAVADAAALYSSPEQMATSAGSSLKQHVIVPATITAIPHEKSVLYLACTQEVQYGSTVRLCNCKVLPVGDAWTCNANHVCRVPAPRFILQVHIADPTYGNLQVKAFHDIAQTLLGCSAEDMMALEARKNQGDAEAAHRIESIFSSATYKRWAIQLKSRQKHGEYGFTVDTQIASCTHLNLGTLAHAMLNEIIMGCGASGGA